MLSYFEPDDLDDFMHFGEGYGFPTRDLFQVIQVKHAEGTEMIDD